MCKFHFEKEDGQTEKGREEEKASTPSPSLEHWALKMGAGKGDGMPWGDKLQKERIILRGMLQAAPSSSICY